VSLTLVVVAASLSSTLVMVAVRWWKMKRVRRLRDIFEVCICVRVFVYMIISVYSTINIF